MPSALEICEIQARKLPVGERAQLAEHLISSLEEPDAAEHQKLWVAEVERRHQAYRHRRTTARSAAEAISQAQALLRERAIL